VKRSSEDDKIISEMTRMLERLDKEDRSDLKCYSCASLIDRGDFYCSTCGEQLRKLERPKVIVRRITVK
jgi:predicted amidophosphoribosyltransferase